MHAISNDTTVKQNWRGKLKITGEQVGEYVCEQMAKLFALIRAHEGKVTLERTVLTIEQQEEAMIDAIASMTLQQFVLSIGFGSQQRIHFAQDKWLPPHGQGIRFQGLILGMPSSERKGQLSFVNASMGLLWCKRAGGGRGGMEYGVESRKVGYSVAQSDLSDTLFEAIREKVSMTQDILYTLIHNLDLSYDK